MARADHGTYRSLYVAVIDDPDFIELSLEAQHAFYTLRMILGPAGIGQIWEGELMGRLHAESWPEVAIRLEELEHHEWILYEKHGGRLVIWIRNALYYEPSFFLTNPKHVTNILRKVADLPPRPIVGAFLDYYRPRITNMDADTKAKMQVKWDRVTDRIKARIRHPMKPPEGVARGREKPDPEPKSDTLFDTVPDTVPDTLPDTPKKEGKDGQSIGYRIPHAIQPDPDPDPDPEPYPDLTSDELLTGAGPGGGKGRARSSSNDEGKIDDPLEASVAIKKAFAETFPDGPSTTVEKLRASANRLELANAITQVQHSAKWEKADQAGRQGILIATLRSVVGS